MLFSASPKEGKKAAFQHCSQAWESPQQSPFPRHPSQHSRWHFWGFRSLKNYRYGSERQKCHQILSTSTQRKKKGHKHKDFGQKPPVPDPPKGPLTLQILYVWGLFSLQNTGKRRLHKEFRGAGVLGARKFSMLNFFACFFAPGVLVMISGTSLVFSRKFITRTGFYRCCTLDASAPVVVRNQSPICAFSVLQQAAPPFNANLDVVAGAC